MRTEQQLTETLQGLLNVRASIGKVENTNPSVEDYLQRSYQLIGYAITDIQNEIKQIKRHDLGDGCIVANPRAFDVTCNGCLQD
jgi:hypothetical protein